jgi:hypothetical protein
MADGSWSLSTKFQEVIAQRDPLIAGDDFGVAHTVEASDFDQLSSEDAKELLHPFSTAVSVTIPGELLCRP